MQKYYVRDFLTRELERNDGRLTQYYIENNHEAIVDPRIGKRQPGALLWENFLLPMRRQIREKEG